MDRAAISITEGPWRFTLTSACRGPSRGASAWAAREHEGFDYARERRPPRLNYRVVVEGAQGVRRHGNAVSTEPRSHPVLVACGRGRPEGVVREAQRVQQNRRQHCRCVVHAHDGMDRTRRDELDDLARRLVGMKEVKRQETAWLRLLEDVGPL